MTDEQPKLPDINVPTLPLPVDSNRVDQFLAHLPPPEHTEFELLCMKRPVMLQGILFDMHFHGDDLLKTQAPGLGEDVFNQLKNHLEDQMIVLDRKYAHRETSGAASWEAYGSRSKEQEDGTDRTRSIKIRVFPRSFYNKLASFKDRLVTERLSKCIMIESYKSGRYKECIYILPYESAPSMVALIEAVNREIDMFNKEVQEYLGSQDYQNVRGVLERFHMEHLVDKKSFMIPHVEYRLIPLALNPNVVMDMVKTKEGTLNEKLQQEYESGRQLLQESLERQSQELVTAALAKLKKEIDANVTQIVMKMKTDPDRVKADLDNIRRKADMIGLEALADSVINPLKLLIDTPDRVEELFGVSVLGTLPEAVDERIKALLKSL
jgi:hypothetical protein